MTNVLSAAEAQQYQSAGYIGAKRVLTPAEAAGYLAQVDDYEARAGGPIAGAHRYKCHLLFPWISQLMRDPRILDPVEDLLGPDLMVWTTHLYPKWPGDGRFISWHQDSAHWGLDSEQIVTAWVALSDASVESGCMRMMPGSHRDGIVEHVDTWDENNILTRGQTIDRAIDEDKAVDVELRAGEMSLHHVNMWHASRANHADFRRLGVAFRYITPQARQQRVDEDYATLVRGEDRFGHFRPEPSPTEEFDPELVALHQHIADLQAKIYLSGTERASLDGLRETNAER
ncbi:MAG: phytanoyl-CoA dioxygenase family protein [Pseudomonadota bacterium]